MLVQNLSNGIIFIKHETCVDPDNEFQLYDDLSDELRAFDEFFKEALRNEVIAVQVFEFGNINTKFSEYFAPKKIWEDNEAWKTWFKNFKESHNLNLYFYNPKDRKKDFLDGTMDMDYSIGFNIHERSSTTEYFELKDYLAHEPEPISSFQIHVDTNVIYEYLKKSNIDECKDLLKEFNVWFLNHSLNKDLLVNEKTNPRIKI